MIRFQCPNCLKVLKAPDNGVGKKVHCPRCRQRLLVPSVPVQPRDETMLGRPILGSVAPPMPQPDVELLAAVPPPGQVVLVSCPGCGRAIQVQPQELSMGIECPQCGARFVPTNPTPMRLPRSQAGADAPLEEVVEEEVVEQRRRRQGKRQSTALPTTLAVTALLSVFWLCFTAFLARGPHWNGSPHTLESYERAVESQERFDRSLAALGVRSSSVFAVIFFFSLVLSFGLVVTSLCLWNMHNVAGRILSVLAGAWLVRCTCCGLW
jgi:DNA-directed RNA polymerase subunit RPC12/RpoP